MMKDRMMTLKKSKRKIEKVYVVSFFTSIAGIIIFIWKGFVGLKISATGLIILIVGFYFLKYLEKEIAEEKLKNDQIRG